jgi:RNA polymerase sigma factor (sigma-70 family)
MISIPGRGIECKVGNKIGRKSVLWLMMSIRQEDRLQRQNKLASFEKAVLPHLDAAYNLARWLTRNDADAEDVVQEAYLRAFKFFDGFRGQDGRAWLLGIVRNTSYTWMQRNRSPQLNMPLDDELHEVKSNDLGPEALLLQKVDAQILRQAVEELPVEFREVLVLRELEDMSYKQIAVMADLPLGTVMSRLARARKRLQEILTSHTQTEVLS